MQPGRSEADRQHVRDLEDPQPGDRSGSSRAWPGVSALALIWGSTWLAIRLTLDVAPPLTAAALRFIVAAVALWSWLLARGRCRPCQPPCWWRSTVMALAMFVAPYGLVYWAELHVSTGLASVLFSSQSLFVVLIAHVALPRERPTGRQWFGVLAGLVGEAAVFHGQLRLSDGHGALGAAAVLVAAASGALALVWLRRLGESLNSAHETAVQLTITALVFGVASALSTGLHAPLVMDWWSTKLWLAVGYLAVPGTAVAYLIYYRLARGAAALTVSYSIFLAPVVAVLLGALVLRERLDALQIAGAVFVLYSMLLAEQR